MRKRQVLVAIIVASLLMSVNVEAQKRQDVAPTPPMGWNSWNWFGPTVTESDVIEIIDYMADSGMRDLGYQYIVVDGGMERR